MIAAAWTIIRLSDGEVILTGARRITVRISPTGRSVRVWVDGVEVKT